MNVCGACFMIVSLAMALFCCGLRVSHGQSYQLPWIGDTNAKLEQELVAKYGEDQRVRVRRGLQQIAAFWRSRDGSHEEFESFVRVNFAGDPQTLDVLFARFETLLEKLDGHMQEIGREFRTQTDLDLGPILPFDEVLAAYDPSAHVVDDFFGNKLAFTVLLNFPLTTLGQRLTEGEKWSRRQWAEARLAQRFSKRVPAEVNQAIARATAEAEQYISQYNIWAHHLITGDGKRLFPRGLRLLSHWNLRDQIKADYSEPRDALGRQRMIQQVMERIVTQTIPAAAINNPRVDWDPFSNDVRVTTSTDTEMPDLSAAKASRVPEPDTRYAMLLNTFLAQRKLDPYSPTAPTLMARRFDEDRELPEARVKAMLERIVSSPLVPKVARIIESRLGRPLEPFDVWYAGFRPRGAYTEEQLDRRVAGRYPTAEAYKKDMPNLLMQLGFSRDRAAYLAANIVVDPARGSGHAMGALMRGEEAHLRTRVEKGGMNYKGFNIAVHEMGHNAEQVMSLNDVDHWLLQGVPNTAFTEALAFVFQSRDLELLGLSKPDPTTRALAALDDFWGAYEISGVALVDMAVWHWMYDHPAATPVQLKEATIEAAREYWNKYYAPVFKRKDVVLLGIYSQMIDASLYLPDYPIGHMIATQVEEQMVKAGKLGPEFERMARIGRIAPDLWMEDAAGQDVSPEALLETARKAIAQLIP